MFVYDHQKRVRYGETDQMGYLYYGNYALLFEIGRVEALRSLGISYKSMEDELRIMMPVISLECRYLAPVVYDELITIRTILRVMPTKLIEFDHEILNAEGKVVHKGIVKLFFVDMDTNKRVSTPSHLVEKLEGYFE